VALSLMLLVGAGLLLKSFRQLMNVDLGFDERNVLTLRLRLPDGKYPDVAQTTGFLKEVTRRVTVLPGVRQVSLATGFPIGRFSGDLGYWLEGQPEPRQPADWPVAAAQGVSESYHQTLGIQLLAGRYLTERDTADAPPVVLVDEDFVQRHFPHHALNDVLGKRLRFGREGETWREVAGIVRHVRQNDVAETGNPQIYLPWLQMNPRWQVQITRAMDLLVKTSVAPLSLVNPIKQEVQAIDRDQPLGNVMALDAAVAQRLAPRRFTLLLLGLFALSALLLGAVGLYGVMSYAVAQRTPEIGLRIALGAQPRDVLRLVMGQGMRILLLGVGIGLAASFGLTRLMKSLLFEVSATDPLTFVGVPLALTAVALLACWIPARRATQVDPLVALRQ